MPHRDPMIPASVVEALHEGLQVIDREWRYVYLNPSAVRHARQDLAALLGRTMMECYPGIDQTGVFAVLRRCMEHRQSDILENEFTYPDGRKGWFELRIEPVSMGIAILSVDITARREAEEQLAQLRERVELTDKMRAIGELAGGVAHDLNNMLGVILGHAALMADGPDRDRVAAIRSAADAAADLVRRMLTIGTAAPVGPVDLADLLRTLRPMLAQTAGRTRVELALGAGVPPILANRGAVEQAVVNLVANARDAMPDGGEVIVELSHLDLDDDYVAVHPTSRPGPHVVLSVTDHGIGMDAETRRRAFEPFFTTKGDAGTGLGLANVYGAMRQCGGHVWLYSEPGLGTTLKLYFPVDVQAAPEVLPRPPNGSTTVLVVDDDDEVRGIAVESLERAGYEVVSASSGQEALNIVRSRPIRVVVSDLVLGDEVGTDVVASIRALQPWVRVVYVSGWADAAVVGKVMLQRGVAYLGKPFSPRRLALKVAEVLQE